MSWRALDPLCGGRPAGSVRARFDDSARHRVHSASRQTAPTWFLPAPILSYLITPAFSRVTALSTRSDLKLRTSSFRCVHCSGFRRCLEEQTTTIQFYRMYDNMLVQYITLDIQ